MAALRRVRARRLSATVPVAAWWAAVAVLAAASLAGCGTQHSPAGATAASPSASRPDPVAACGKPTTSFARFWFITMEPDPSVYQGTVLVGSARVPASSMYVSGGPPGAGTLCVSSQAGVHDPIEAVAAPRPGAIAYVGATGSPPDTVYFATRPGVTRVTLHAGITTVTYSTGAADETLRLQPLGSGWHADNSGYGIGGVTSVTLRAYNSAGQLMGTVVDPLAAPTPSPPAAAATATR
jgi:hypothetical protein